MCAQAAALKESAQSKIAMDDMSYYKMSHHEIYVICVGMHVSVAMHMHDGSFNHVRMCTVHAIVCTQSLLNTKC